MRSNAARPVSGSRPERIFVLTTTMATCNMTVRLRRPAVGVGNRHIVASRRHSGLRNGQGRPRGAHGGGREGLTVGFGFLAEYPRADDPHLIKDIQGDRHQTLIKRIRSRGENRGPPEYLL